MRNLTFRLAAGLVLVGSVMLNSSTAHAELLLGTATMMPVPPNGDHADYSPNISSDNLELYFASTRPGPFGDYSTWVARRESPSGPFGVPEAVSSLNHPSISHDGLSLYGNLSVNGQDLFVITRPTVDAAWSAPINLGSSINTDQHERGCSITADDLELYFNRGWDNPASSNAIWVAKRSDPSDPFGEPVKLPPIINGPEGTWAPEISDDGLMLVFASERPGGLGLDDFWVSTRPMRDDGWSEPEHLGSAVNSPLWDDTTDISPDGRVFYFARSTTTSDFSDWNLWQAPLYLPGDHFASAQFPNAIYTVADTPNNPAFDNLGDDASSKASAPASAVGERDTQDANAVVRLIAKFDLPQMPDVDRRLDNATLHLFLDDIAGTPAGPVSLFHSVGDNDLEELSSDYEDGSYIDTQRDLVHPTDTAQQYYELDVTDLVLADYAEDGDNPLSAFRLQVDEAVFLEDNQSHRYRFTMPGAGINPPELVLTFIPEPSTLVLCSIALGVVGWRKRGGVGS